MFLEVGALDRMDGMEILTTPLVDASPLLQDPPRLQALARRDGFLWLPGLLPAACVLALRDAVVEFAQESGWLQDGAAKPGKRIGYYQDPDWVNLQIHVQNKPEMWAAGDHPAIHEALYAAEGRSSYLNLSTANTCRVFSPHPDMATQPHQDAHYFRLIADFWTVWVPLGDCPLQLGPLALAAGSHHGGMLDHTGHGIVDGGVQMPPDTVWSAGDLQCGDVILFRPLTVHRSLPNQSGTQLRISADFRYGFWEERGEVDWRHIK
ncbi:MAG: phytanoyl-CoA dioxygenase family protein [Bryobacterales bacterium]|nr:phytanoyl-CoA dioxygenase family protein [Bryobacterales bacterium]